MYKVGSNLNIFKAHRAAIPVSLTSSEETWFQNMLTRLPKTGERQWGNSREMLREMIQRFLFAMKSFCDLTSFARNTIKYVRFISFLFVSSYSVSVFLFMLDKPDVK